MKKSLKASLSAVILFICTLPAISGIAEITAFKGSVSFIRPGEIQWSEAARNLQLNAGDRIRTGSDSSAELSFTAGHTASLGPSSNMMIKESSEDSTNIDLFTGDLLSRVGRLNPGQTYEVTTPQAVCAVRGTEFSVFADENQTRVEVLSGIVEAREIITGLKVDIGAGHYTRVAPGRQPSTPREISTLSVPEETRPATPPGLRQAARREMFNEISRAAVLARAAQEMKQAEYENRKVMVDAHGNRVRLEEYIVRPQSSNTDFKYVVLNHRDERLDFGKIHFFFSAALPEDLTLVTGSMFRSRTKPDIILTELVSVISNTRDRVNEDASGGDMVQDKHGIWHHYFAEEKFIIKGEGRKSLTLWTRDITLPGGSKYEDIGDNTTINYLEGSKPDTIFEMPSGADLLHTRIKDTYADGTWIRVDDYIIDDEGEILSISDLRNRLELNAQRRYESSEFGGRNINLVLSTKLLFDAGILE